MEEALFTFLHLQETHMNSHDKHRLKVMGWNIFIEVIGRAKATATILISFQIVLRLRNFVGVSWMKLSVFWNEVPRSSIRVIWGFYSFTCWSDRHIASQWSWNKLSVDKGSFLTTTAPRLADSNFSESAILTGMRWYFIVLVLQFGATLGDVQGILIAPCSGITPGSPQGST